MNTTKKNANRYLKDIRSKNEDNKILRYRLASEDANDLSGLQPDVLAGSANSSSTRRDFGFITESYRQAAQILASGKNIFYARCSVLKNGSNPDRLSMYVDIILKPGDKPHNYTIDGRSSRYRYEIRNSISADQADWSGWDKVLGMYDQFEYARIGRLRNRSRNTSIVPRNRVPYCAGGVFADGSHSLYAYLQLRDNTIMVPLTEIDASIPENTRKAKFFSHQGTYCGDVEQYPEYDLSELEL